MAIKLSGTVTKKNLAKTVTVAIEVVKVHPIYKKRYRVSRSLLAHDPSDSLIAGHDVILSPARPISKRKHWIAKAVEPAIKLRRPKLAIKKYNKK